MPKRAASIMVVEDDPALLRMFRRQLEEHGYLPIPCESGLQALRMAVKRSPDAVLLDASLGEGISGFQVCALLRQERRTVDVPVIMMSGTFVVDALTEEARRAGAFDCLRKPAVWSEIEPKLARALEARKTGEVAPYSPPETGPSSGTVLVADDDEDYLSLASLWLKEAGFTVVTTGEGKKVPDLVMKHKPDCIVLDYLFKSENLTAEDICRRLQANMAAKATPVVVLTARGAMRERTLDNGADYFVVKDGKSGELVRNVKICVRRKAWSSGIAVKGDLKLDPNGLKVCLDGNPEFRLNSEQQFLFLYTLLQRCPQSVSRLEMHLLIFGVPPPSQESKALDRLVERLKEALVEPLAGRIGYIKNWGWIYKLPLPKASPTSQSDLKPAGSR